MNSKRRLIAALDGFARARSKGVRSKKHVVPLVEFAAAELAARGVRTDWIQMEDSVEGFSPRRVDLVVRSGEKVLLSLVVVTQSGSVRKNLNNRRRDVLGDGVNLRAACPDAKIALIYLLRADAEAKRKGSNGTSPIDELASFLQTVQSTELSPGKPILDAAALLAADVQAGGRVMVEPVPREVDVLKGFFDRAAESCKA